MLNMGRLCGKRPSLKRHAIRRALVAIVVAFALIVGSGIMALNNGGGLKRMEAQFVAPSVPANTSSVSAGTVSPGSLTPDSPSKEYIYVGGRLVATEEPAP